MWMMPARELWIMWGMHRAGCYSSDSVFSVLPGRVEYAQRHMPQMLFYILPIQTGDMIQFSRVICWVPGFIDKTDRRSKDDRRRCGRAPAAAGYVRIRLIDARECRASICAVARRPPGRSSTSSR